MSAKDDLTAEFARLLEEQHAPTSSPELALVALLRETGAALEPRTALAEDVRAAQRKRLLAVAHVQSVNAAAPAVAEPASGGLLAGLRRFGAGLQATRRTAAVAGGMASVVAVLGVGVAATQSLPGDPFYGVKRTTEDVQLKLKTSDESRGELHLAIAQTRLREVDGLANGRDAFALGALTTGPSGLGALGGSTASLIAETLEAMDDETGDGVRDLIDASAANKDDAPLKTIQAFAVEQGQRISALLPDLPAASRAQAQASLKLVMDAKAESEQRLKGQFCTEGCNPATALPTVPPVPGPASPAATPTTPPCTCPPTAPAAPEPEPTTEPAPAATPEVPPATPPVVVPPTTPPAVPTTPPVVPPVPTPTVTPIIVLPTEIPLPLPSIDGLPLPTSVPLPDLELPTIPGLPPVLGN